MKRACSGTSNEGSKRPKASSNAERISVDDAIEYLVSGDIRLAGKVQVPLSFKKVEEASHSVGLSPDDIIMLVDVIGGQKFSTTLSRKLVYCLIPTRFVAEAAVINAISYISMQELPISLQVDLLKWILAVYDLIDKKEIFPHLYGIIFVLLESDLLRPFACQLLFKMTKEEHVQPFRIAHLIDLQSKVGPQPHLLGLLQLYTNYRPDLVIVQCKYKNAFRSLGRLPLFIEHVRQKIATQHLKEHEIQSRKTEEIISRKEITDYAHLSEELNSLNRNSGVMKLLQSPLRRILFTSDLPETLLIRLSLFLRVSLFTETSWNISSLKNCSRGQLLPLLCSISSDLQEGIPDVLCFIGSYLKIWDGKTNLDIILNLVQYWEICPFEDLLETVLKPFYKRFCYSSVHFKCSVIRCLANLYQHWVLFETPRYLAIKGKSLTGSSTKCKQIYVFERTIEEFDPEEQIEALGNYIDRLCTVALCLHKNHPPVLLYHVLNFYEMVLLVHEQNSSAPLILPSQPIVCASAFSSNAAVLSQMCALITRFVGKVPAAKRNSSSSLFKTPQIIHLLNSYVSDICNMFIRRFAFLPKKETDEKSTFFVKCLPSSVAASVTNVGESFCIFRHPALLGLAIDFLDSNAIKELSPSLLLKGKESRNAYLCHMSRSGFADVDTFLKSFINFKKT